MPPKKNHRSGSLTKTNEPRIKLEREEAKKTQGGQRRARKSACGGRRPPRGAPQARRRHGCIQAIPWHQLLRVEQGTAYVRAASRGPGLERERLHPSDRPASKNSSLWTGFPAQGAPTSKFAYARSPLMVRVFFRLMMTPPPRCLYV